MTRYETMQVDLGLIRAKYRQMKLQQEIEIAARRAELDSALASAIKDSPTMTHREIAAMFGCDSSYVSDVAIRYECRRPKGRGSKAWKDQRRTYSPSFFPVT